MPDVSHPTRTTSLRRAASADWDVVVIGAGPAGSMAAAQTATAGARVLLVDRDTFPRAKVCGCCLNDAGLRVLASAGLGDLPARLGAPALRDFLLTARGRTATLPLPHGVALSRERLDAALIDAAIDRGAHFLDRTRAEVRAVDDSGANDDTANDDNANRDAGRAVRLRDDEAAVDVRARAVIIASGLGARSFAARGDDERAVDRASRIGAGTIIDAGLHDRRPGRLEMAVARDGYAGLVVLEDGRLDIAAALDASAVQGRPLGHVVAGILGRAGVSIPTDLEHARWTGTPMLTQRRAAVAGPGYFVIGDAAGYVEPFTGEGMSWALATGAAVAPFALDAIARTGRSSHRSSAGDAGRTWARTHHRLLAHRQRSCRHVSRVLRRESLTALSIRLLARAPALARPIVRRLNASFVV